MEPKEVSGSPDLLLFRGMVSVSSEVETFELKDQSDKMLVVEGRKRRKGSASAAEIELSKDETLYTHLDLQNSWKRPL